MARKNKQEQIKETFVPMKDVTNCFSNMIEAFESDFVLARNKQTSLIDLQTQLQTEDIKLLQDIELLEYLSYGIRHGTIKIYEKEVE